VRPLALAAAVLLASCAGNPNLPPPPNWISGHVTYRERMALPPDAEVRVTLVDASRQDSAAVVADTVIRPRGPQVPVPFVLRFDRRRIDERRDYALRATITSGGRLAFTTPTVVKVVTRDHPNMVDLVLTRVQAPTAASPRDSSASGLAGLWVLEDIGGTGVIDNARATLELGDSARVAGRGSCNQFSGPVTVSGSTISFGPLAATRMACAPAVMDQETRYFKALADAERYAIEGSSLLIFAKGMAKPLRFTREKP
jgi:putative lipoprotein